MKRRRRQIKQFDSVDLSKSFNDRFMLNAQKPSDFTGNDAFQIVRRNSDVFDSMLSSIMLIGKYPWEDDSDTRVLYRFPPADGTNDKNDDSLLPFVLPEMKKGKPSDNNNDNIFFDKIDEIEKSGLNHCILQNVEADFFKSHLIDDSNIAQAKFIPLYLTTDRGTSPYVFCLLFYTSIFNLPSLSHNFSMPELMQHLKYKEGQTKFDLHFTRLCFCVKTKLPFYSLFLSFMIWVLRCELVGRMQMFQAVSDLSDYILNQKDPFNENYPNFLEKCFQNYKWPDPQKSDILNFIEIFGSLSVPFPNEVISFDKKPFPSFHWKRPNNSITYYSLAQEAINRLVKCVGTKENFVKLFFSILLERTIVIHSDDPSLTSWLVLALHFLIRPLIWVSVSISILPQRLNELLGAPYPLICGIAFDFDSIDNFEDISSMAVYLDTKRPYLYLPTVNPNMSLYSESSPVIYDQNDCNGDNNENDENYDYRTRKWKKKKRNSIGDLNTRHLVGGSGVYNKIYEDLVDEVILPPAPQQKIFTEDIEGCWESSSSTILTIASHFVSSILKEVDSCIMTNISDPTNTSSIFVEELFMKCFPQIERNFVKLMISTQMFRFFVEQKCRMRSERLKMQQ
ncbi:hypothetical protein M9Y10_038159 [Tritrichomonas musculus]|uniref:UDENN domain-containing protein n=1 Tax=Tritrichomonas musculus TaxID=1915356 RepID=A0ABR2K8M1_9EUKA